VERIKGSPAFRETMFFDAEVKADTAKILPGLRYHKDGAAVIRELLKKGSISMNAYKGLVDVHARGKLLESNVFAFHINSREVSFQSTVMKRFCEENRALWGEK
jgi:hypothetical protein